MSFKKRSIFFSHFPHGLLVEFFVGDHDIKRAFCRGEEGDFVFHLLLDSKTEELHVAESDPQARMTFHIKFDMLSRLSWNDFVEYFGGVNRFNRLQKSGRWLVESLHWYKKRKTHAKYLHTIQSWYAFKKRLSVLKLHKDDFFTELKSRLPHSFDFIYIGRMLDEPGLFTEQEWPKAIQSRMTPNGLLMLLTDQDEKYVKKQMRICGFKIGGQYNVDSNVKAFVFSCTTE